MNALEGLVMVSTNGTRGNGFSSDSTPVGLQLMGVVGDDRNSDGMCMPDFDVEAAQWLEPEPVN